MPANGIPKNVRFQINSRLFERPCFSMTVCFARESLEHTMARHVLLNNVEHKNLRVITQRGAQYGDNVGNVVVLPTEYRELQREYPIFFRKEPGGDRLPVGGHAGFCQRRESLSRRFRAGTRAIFRRSSRAALS